MKRLVSVVTVVALLLVCLLVTAVSSPHAHAATISSTTHAVHATSHGGGGGGGGGGWLPYCNGGVEVEGHPTAYPYPFLVDTCLPLLTVNATFTQIVAVCNDSLLGIGVVVSQGVQIAAVLPGECLDLDLGTSSVSVPV